MLDSKNVFLKRIYNVVLILFIICMASCRITHIGSGRINAQILEPGNVTVPLGEEGRAEALIEQFGKDDLSSKPIMELIHYWAAKDLPKWDYDGAKVNAPRILLAKLITGTDIEMVNNYLLNIATLPWSKSGSTWLLRNGGDYDFTEVPLTAILYKFGNKPELLYPKTKEHLLHTLLIESGNQVRKHVPGSLNIVPDTENHILMTEGSRYLKNQWLRTMEGVTDSKYDNSTNGVEAFLVDFLDELIGAGLFEFNSMPYSGYTISALLNLEAFAEYPVSSKARELLDTIMYKFALGSLDMRRCVPFRRQIVKAGTTSIQADDASMISRIWVTIDNPDFKLLPVTERLHNSFYASIMPYRMPDKTLSLIKEKETAYFVLLGRGSKASPEIFSSGPGYLLSAGGVSRGSNSMIVSRPTTLILSDKQTDYTNCFYLPGKGTYKDWNNTGVFRNFACSNSPVVIPSWAIPIAEYEGWSIYNFNDSLLIAVFNHDTDSQFGVLALFPNYSDSPAYLARSLKEANPDSKRLLSEFVWPNNDVITYDVNAPKDQWVIISYNDELLDRNFDTWPRINTASIF